MTVPFTDVLEDVTKYAKRIPQSEYSERGDYPIIDQGSEYIGGFSSNAEGLSSSPPYIIFGDHTRILKYVECPCFIGADGVKLLKVSNAGFLPKYVYYNLLAKPIEGQGYSRHFKFLKELTLSEKSLNDQLYIVSLLDGLNSQIKKNEDEIILLNEQVKSLFNEMFSNVQMTMPLIDFIQSGAGLSYGIVQPGEDGTGDMGVIRPVDMSNGAVDLKTIKYINRSIGDGYKRTELNGHEILITVRGTTGEVALSNESLVGMNVTRGIAVIRYDARKINPIYLLRHLVSAESAEYIQENTRGATLKQINLSDLKQLQIKAAPLTLQESFAERAQQIDKLRFNYQRQIEVLQELMDKKMEEYFGGDC